MEKGREKRIQKLITNYIYWDNLDNNFNNRWTIYLARDNKRKIKKVFLKEIHEPIENFIFERR